jgi:hypothetical protein
VGQRKNNLKLNYNTNKSKKPNQFQGHLRQLMHCHLEYAYIEVQIRPHLPSVSLKSPFRRTKSGQNK